MASMVFSYLPRMSMWASSISFLKSGVSFLTDRAGFFVLYPEGMNLFGFLSHWNAGHCCGKAAADGVDDVGFLAEAIERVCKAAGTSSSQFERSGFIRIRIRLKPPQLSVYIRGQTRRRKSAATPPFRHR